MAEPREAIVDRQRWRAITLDDEAYARELMQVLLEDTRKHQSEIEEAIVRHDAAALKRLAHYCKGAFDGVGARSSARLSRALEQEAAHGDFRACRGLLEGLFRELEKWEREVRLIPPLAPLSAGPAPRPGTTAPRA